MLPAHRHLAHSLTHTHQAQSIHQAHDTGVFKVASPPPGAGNKIKLFGKKEGKGKSEGKREVKGNLVEKWVAEEIKLDATLFTFYKLFRSTALIVVFVFQFI